MVYLLIVFKAIENGSFVYKGTLCILQVLFPSMYYYDIYYISQSLNSHKEFVRNVQITHTRDI